MSTKSKLAKKMQVLIDKYGGEEVYQALRASEWGVGTFVQEGNLAGLKALAAAREGKPVIAPEIFRDLANQWTKHYAESVYDRLEKRHKVTEVPLDLKELKSEQKSVSTDYNDLISPEKEEMYLRVFGKEQGTRLLNDMRASQKALAAYKAELFKSRNDDSKQ